jgi:hypothetical protein
MVIGVAALQLPEKQNQESINRTFGNWSSVIELQLEDSQNAFPTHTERKDTVPVTTFEKKAEDRKWSARHEEL